MIFYGILVLMFLGSTLVFYSLSPYFGALGLVMVAVSGCLLCSLLGLSFIALILILIYMGGMLVVFVYSTAISAERYPVVSNFLEVGVLSVLVVLWVFLNFNPFLNSSPWSWAFFIEEDFLGGSFLYFSMGWYLLVGGYVLLVALIGALVVTYGSDYSVLKAL
uniref:NADH-ubiquinone oxidoreductase chain 6 n=1 Tax=Protoreaster nodosus TaxID=572528 RepID=A0A7S8CUH9_PRONO|nr:NADH dehydrogenase subunit 6 [Protoreaster nodosus]QPC56379.1 NADH dehydrogenase subunit 6 [Protoreaster nodosus]